MAATGTEPCLFVDREQLTHVAQRMQQQRWVRPVLAKVRQSARRSLRLRGEHLLHALWRQGHVVRDKALVMTVDGSTQYLGEVTDAIAAAFEADRKDSEAPGAASQFSYLLGRGGHFFAWDLLKDHPELPANQRRRVEHRLGRVLAIKKEVVRDWPTERLYNTALWNVTSVGLLGFLLGDDEAIAIGVDGFKRALTRLRDGLFWPEATMYGHKYVRCCLTLLAEAALHTGHADLWRYRTDQGHSLKSVYDGYLRLLFANGRFATCGDYSTQSPIVSRREQYTTHDVDDGFLFPAGRNFRQTNSYEIAYARYGDPQHAWVLGRDRQRLSWDHTFWGYAALTHGVPLGEQTPPPADSALFPEYGAALVRSDETSRYWQSNAPAIFVRTGQGAWQSHGHYDHFGLVLNAFGRNIYPDWFYQWDYQRRVDSACRKLDPTRCSTWAVGHNTLVVDGRNPVSENVKLAAFERADNRKVIELVGRPHRGVTVRRRLTLMLDRLEDVFEAEATRPRRFDYVLHGFGRLTLRGVGAKREYEALGADFGLGAIDLAATSKDNQWIRRARRAATDKAWSATFRDEDGVGCRLQIGGARGTEMFTADMPYYVAERGWDELPADGVVRAMPMLVIRRRGRRLRLVVTHRPFG